MYTHSQSYVLVTYCDLGVIRPFIWIQRNLTSLLDLYLNIIFILEVQDHVRFYILLIYISDY